MLIFTLLSEGLLPGFKVSIRGLRSPLKRSIKKEACNLRFLVGLSYKVISKYMKMLKLPPPPYFILVNFNLLCISSHL